MSTLRLTTISNQTGSASVPSDTVINGSAKAWVNFNGTGTVAIRASFNVSSITDGGVGDYTVNFTTAMTDANYSVQLASGDNNSGYAVIAGLASGNTAGAAKVATLNGGFSARQDSAYVFVAIFR